MFSEPLKTLLSSTPPSASRKRAASATMAMTGQRQPGGVGATPLNSSAFTLRRSQSAAPSTSRAMSSTMPSGLSTMNCGTKRGSRAMASRVRCVEPTMAHTKGPTL